MRTKNLASSLFSKTKLNILRELMRDTTGGLHLRELARRANISAGSVSRELHNLRVVGIVTVRQSGNQTIYQLNRECPIYSEIVMLITKTAGIADEIKSALAPLAEKIKTAYIYGSIARGDDKSDSDVDLIVVGEISLKEVVNALSDVESRIRREINPSVYKPKEYSARLKQGEGFIHEIHNGQRIIIIESNEPRKTGK